MEEVSTPSIEIQVHTKLESNDQKSFYETAKDFDYSQDQKLWEQKYAYKNTRCKTPILYFWNDKLWSMLQKSDNAKGDEKTPETKPAWRTLISSIR